MGTTMNMCPYVKKEKEYNKFYGLNYGVNTSSCHSLTFICIFYNVFMQFPVCENLHSIIVTVGWLHYWTSELVANSNSLLPP